MASQPSTSGLAHDLACKVQELERELTEARQQHAATGEILRVISATQTDVQQVFDTIIANAVKLCSAHQGAVYLYDGELVHLGAHRNYAPEIIEILRRMYPRPPQQDQVSGRAILSRAIAQIEDMRADPLYTPELTLAGAWRSQLAVPMVREGRPIGAIVIARPEAGSFSASHIELLKTFANQAVIAIENTRLFEEVQARTRQLTESLEYQTATSEVLNVISRSPSQLQPVLDAIVTTAGGLCQAQSALVWLFGSGKARLAAADSAEPDFVDYLRDHPISPTRGNLVGRVLMERRTVHIEDLLADPEYTDLERQSVGGYRTVLGVPLLRNDEPIGLINLIHNAVKPFTARQIELIETFADQAVIAIENTRLFEEVQARTRELTQRTRELTETLEYQTATSEVLGVISRSPNELQPVLDTIVETAARLCNADYSQIMRARNDGTWYAAALFGHSTEYAEYLKHLKVEPGRGSITGRALLSGKPTQIADVMSDPDYELHEAQRIAGYRTHLGVPLSRKAQTVGMIILSRKKVAPFSAKEIELVETFADQALIAIENTRLFEEVQARNTELRVALEQQTATSELLKVIGRSTFDLKPVFETLIENAVKLCGATRGFISRFDGRLLRFAAGYNVTPQLREYFEQNPFSPDRHSNTGRAALEHRTVHNIDVRADPEYTYGGSEVDPYRTVLAIPMLKAEVLLGVILIYRHEVLPFTESQIALVETFADQAVIAIENARLFEEVQARNRDLTALGEVGRAVSSSLELKVVLPRILEHACALSDTGGGAIYVFDRTRSQFDLEAGLNMSEELIAEVREHPIRFGESLVGQCAERREAVQFDDLSKAPPHPLYEMHMKAGVRALLAVPLLHQGEVVGALVVRRMRTGAFALETTALLQSFASQSAIAIQNAGLFEEIAQKSRELEIASQHKSQFVANMSHELRTPLAAVLGYAELLQEGIYGALPGKSLPILTRIRSNGNHLLGLINTVLDISKIEAGQFKLNLAEYALGSMVETVMVATESLAATKKLAFKTDVAKELPYGLGDEQRLTQVLLNLVGNAIKFTDTGEVCIAAAAANGHFTVSVSDTGPGIPPEECEHIFEKFRQVDSSNTRAKGGTGLGLAIAREIVEMHGGRIWVESRLGQGSTFRMELPVRAPITAGAA